MTQKPFIHEDFLLQNKTARMLFHDFAAGMPVFDYQTALPVKEIAENSSYQNISQVWIRQDPYKWRAMRANGVREKFITGGAPDWEKFEAFARTSPFTLCHPLYHWIHLELKKPFGITDKLLNYNTAKEIYEVCNEKLQSTEFTARGLIRQFNVKFICTNDDPVDSLEFHRTIADDQSVEVKVHPVFNTGGCLNIEYTKTFNEWISRLERSAGVYISNHKSFLEALKKRHDYFHELGCRMSSQSLIRPFSKSYSDREIAQTFAKARKGVKPHSTEVAKFKSWVTYELAMMDSEKRWTQQIQLGALRSNTYHPNKKAGRDPGVDSVADLDFAIPLIAHLDRLIRSNRLPKTVAFSLNRKDSMTLASLLGNYQDGSMPSKMQYAPSWWFREHKEGIEEHLATLSNTGLLSRFIGMSSGSRHFFSFSRHEYFRRILCNWLGTKVENGELPHDMGLLGNMVKNICYHNAEKYFRLGMSDKKQRKTDLSKPSPPDISEKKPQPVPDSFPKETPDVPPEVPPASQSPPSKPDIAAEAQPKPEDHPPAVTSDSTQDQDAEKSVNELENQENTPQSPAEAKENPPAPVPVSDSPMEQPESTSDLEKEGEKEDGDQPEEKSE